MHTIYGEIPDSVVAKLRRVRLLFCDVDGVFTDGRIYMGNAGEELKAFHAKDGFGVKVLQATGVRVAVITGRESMIVERRMTDLGISIVEQGCVDKATTFKRLVAESGVSTSEVAFVGDDMPDHDCMQTAGVAIAVQDAHPSILEISDYVTRTAGGRGAVREVTDSIMMAQNTFHRITASSSSAVSG